MLVDDTVAPHHAEVVVTDDGRFYVTDCASATGTWRCNAAGDGEDPGHRTLWEPVRQAFVRGDEPLCIGEHRCTLNELLGTTDEAPAASGTGGGAQAGEERPPRLHGRVARDARTGEIVRKSPLAVDSPPGPRTDRPRVQRRPHKRPLTPWLAIWTEPRATMRRILAFGPGRITILLVCVGAFSQVLDSAAERGLAEAYGLGVPRLVLACALVGPLLGLAVWYVLALLLRWTGNWLDGKGTLRELRAAIAWSYVPVIWGLLIWLPYLVVFGPEVFRLNTPRMDANPALVIVFDGLQTALAVWAFVIFVKCLAEVQKLSAWKALGNALLALLFLVVPIVLIFLAVAGTLTWDGGLRLRTPAQSEREADASPVFEPVAPGRAFVIVARPV